MDVQLEGIASTVSTGQNGIGVEGPSVNICVKMVKKTSKGLRLPSAYNRVAWIGLFTGILRVHRGWEKIYRYPR